MKEEIRARCPLCGGEIIVSEYYQTSRDYKVLMNGKLSKRYIVTDAGPINSMTASCGSFCGAYWEHEEFDISEDGMFYDKKYLEEEIMNNIEIKQITKIDDDTLATITKWMHNWWGRED